MPKLYFENPEFHPGVNLTVRRGTKWNTEKKAILADLAGKEYGEVVLDSRVFRFCDLNESDLALEHDANCRTGHGLFKVMKKLYPSFDVRELVTLVTFEI